MGLPMLRGPYLSILDAHTPDDFRTQLIRYSKQLGFDRVGAMCVVDHSSTHTEFHVVHNTPAAYIKISHDPAMTRADPVMQHCRSKSVPIIWNRDTYLQRGCGDLWDLQAPYGYKTGVALALHLPEDKHFCIGADRDKPLPDCSNKLTRIVADLQLFAVHAQEAALRIFMPEAPSVRSGGPSLTPRELEALRWTMDGKLAWEVGEALNISERTVVFHLRNATRKLGCNSKFHAVLKAMRLGLLN